MDSRTVEAVLKKLAESPRPIAEADFDPKTGQLTRIVFESAGRQGVRPGLVSLDSAGSIPATGSERNATPKTPKPKEVKSAVASLKLAPPEWQPEIEVANG